MPERNQDSPPSPEQRMRAAYESAESATAAAFEQAVDTPSFGAILVRSAENVAALHRITTEVGDAVLRNLRIAGRADITRLSRQLHRTEDKLERVLQEVEAVRDELAAARADAAARPDGRTDAAARTEAATRPDAGADPAGNGRADATPATPRRRPARTRSSSGDGDDGGDSR